MTNKKFAIEKYRNSIGYLNMDCIMKKILCCFVLSFVMFFGLGNSTVLAVSPWLWDLTLQEVKPDGIMNLPTAIFIDKSTARYYVVDGGNNRLVSYDRQGKFLSAFTANNSLQTPFYLVIDPGVLLVV